MNKILVIIVTYNAMQWAERCFSSLRYSTVKPDVYVVDNGSTDGTQNYIQQNYPEFMFHQSSGNIGFGKANNLGLQFALDYEYDFVYLLNQDAWVMQDTLERLIELNREYPEYGILSPFQMEANLYHIDKNFIQYVCGLNSNNEILDDIYNNQIKPIYTVPFVMAAHWFMTKECIICIGGFSPTFPHYREDNNYCDRMMYHNIKIGIVPSLKVVHDRQNRKNDKQKEIHLDYTFLLNELSNPLTQKQYQVLFIIKESMRLCIKYKSIVPLQNMYRILHNLKKISENRKISLLKTSPFLNH